MAAPHVMDTASGVQLDLDNPLPKDINLGDIAAALSKVCRFGAQAKQFYSVALHAVMVRRIVVEEFGRPDLALYALHHDSHEAYVCDIPRPLKLKLKDEGNAVYDRVCDALDLAIAMKLEFEIPAKGTADQQLVKLADDKALITEARLLIHDGGAGILAQLGANDRRVEDLDPIGQLDEPVGPGEAEVLFRQAHSDSGGPTGR